MNNSTKILLKIDLQGVLGDTSKNVEIIPYSYNIKGEGNTINEVRGHSKHKNKEIKPCTQHIKLTQDAYNLFISDEVPYWMKEDVWKKLSQNERITAHCARIAQENKFNFQILE